MSILLTAGGILAARDLIDPVFLNSPQMRHPALDEALGGAVTLKVETLNPIRSFKGSIVEHPFGSLKCRVLGNGRLLLRHLKGARTEMALAVLAYNFRRVSNILGSGLGSALS